MTSPTTVSGSPLSVLFSIALVTVVTLQGCLVVTFLPIDSAGLPYSPLVGADQSGKRMPDWPSKASETATIRPATPSRERVLRLDIGLAPGDGSGLGPP